MESILPVQHAWVDQVPLIWVEPGADQRGPRRLAIWLPGLTGRKEDLEPHLRQLAERGMVAVSFDPYQHGERGSKTKEQIGSRVFTNFRRLMWPILDQTSLDTLRVIDWAVTELRVEKQVVMGGISMGGDISVTAAGLDRRITRVAAAIATPDWLRPGMNRPAGEPDAYARMMYERDNPLTHLERYARPDLAITFECGAQDDHVPPDGALRFRDALRGVYADRSAEVRVTLHEGVKHGFTPEMWQNCLDWLSQ